MALHQKTDVGTNINNIESKSNKLANSRVIDVTITELILTPLSCAYIVNEIIKCLMYQKSQIPYPYNWLKTVVNRKRCREAMEDCSKTRSFTVSSHYREASSAFDSLDEIMKALIEEFSCKCSLVKEVIVVFGTVPQCAKQVYSINIPTIATGHVETNHANDSLKHQHKVLRNIFMSQSWINSIDSDLSVLNTYIFLKKQQLHLDDKRSEQLFVPAKPFSPSSMTRRTTINLNYTPMRENKCCNFEIYDDDTACGETAADLQGTPDAGSVDGVCWLEAKSPIKGFKDCYINKVSASELW